MKQFEGWIVVFMRDGPALLRRRGLLGLAALLIPGLAVAGEPADS
jgi:hypothetical protein